MKIAVPDLISNSYFPAPAAVELGFFEAEGIDMSYEMIFPVDDANKAMRDGKVDFVAGSAHSTLAAFPGWNGAKLVCALSQGMYWLLIMRTDLGIARGDVDALKGRHIGAAPWVELGLRRMLREAGVDPDNDLTIAPIPGTVRPGVSFGVTAAKALEDGKIDGFWANAMGAEVAVRSGTGTVVLDPRRGLGPAAAFDYTWPTLATTDALIEREPETVAAAIRAVVAVQAALVADVSRATEVGDKTFPAAEASMIADVVARDLAFYDAAISEKFVAGMNQFAVDMGLLDAPVGHDQVVATRFSELWSA